MTEAEERAILVFDMKVRKLIEAYSALQQENAELKSAIADAEEEKKKLNGLLEQSRKDYDNLKFAKMISISDSDKKDAKYRITKLVRDVNKCIALLSTDAAESDNAKAETAGAEMSKEAEVAKNDVEETVKAEKVAEHAKSVDSGYVGDIFGATDATADSDQDSNDKIEATFDSDVTDETEVGFTTEETISNFDAKAPEADETEVTSGETILFTTTSSEEKSEDGE